MSGDTAPVGFEPPDRKSILIGSAIALGVALVVLLAVILPAEYGRDPTGIGGLLGITGMSAGGQTTETIQWTDNAGGNEILREAEIPDFGEPTPLPNPDVALAEDAPPKSVTMHVELAPEERTEIKMTLAEGRMAVYEWQVDDGMVYSEFHGHTPEYGEDFWVMYKRDLPGAAAGQGSLVAPFSGEHGWYWQNLEDHPVTITVTMTGFFDDVRDLRDDF